MHYEITASQQAVRKPLTSAQRNSSLFSEAPRIGAVTLRRGQVLKFDSDQMKHHEVMLKRLFDAGAIEISQVDGDRRRDFRTEEVKMKRVEEPKKEAPPPPPSAPKPPPSAPKVIIPPPAPEPVKEAPEETPEEVVTPKAEEVVAAVEAPVPPPSAPSAPVSSSESSKGKKGKR
jgi:hypothetical protein